MITSPSGDASAPVSDDADNRPADASELPQENDGTPVWLWIILAVVAVAAAAVVLILRRRHG